MSVYKLTTLPLIPFSILTSLLFLSYVLLFHSSCLFFSSPLFHPLFVFNFLLFFLPLQLFPIFIDPLTILAVVRRRRTSFVLRGQLTLLNPSSVTSDLLPAEEVTRFVAFTTTTNQTDTSVLRGYDLQGTGCCDPLLPPSKGRYLFPFVTEPLMVVGGNHIEVDLTLSPVTNEDSFSLNPY